MKFTNLAVLLGSLVGCISPDPPRNIRPEIATGRSTPGVDAAALAKLTEKAGFTVLADGHYRFDVGTLFNAGQAKLNSVGLERVHLLAEGIRGSDSVIRIDGHVELNPIRSLWRAGDDFILPYLQSVALKHCFVAAGIPADRVICVSFGSTRPCAPNDSKANKCRNRRIEIRVQPLVTEARVLPVADPWPGGCGYAPLTLAGFRIPDHCRFGPGSKDLTVESLDLLRNFAAWSLPILADRDDVLVGLDGRSGPGENLASKTFGDDKLAFFRAWKARDEIIKAGVPAERAVIMSTGVSSAASDPSCNRRVDLWCLPP